MLLEDKIRLFTLFQLILLLRGFQENALPEKEPLHGEWSYNMS